MKKIHKIICILMAIVICLTASIRNVQVSHAGNKDTYLVLVQQKNGSWKEYKNIIEVSDDGNLMLKAKSIAKALGFTYKNSKNSFEIKRSSSRYNTYTKNNAEYTYTNGETHTQKTALNKAFTSKKSKFNLCQISTLGSLVYCKYFSNSDSDDYEDYNGVICYSKYKEIPNTVPANAKPSTSEPTPTPKSEPAVVDVEGVEFPVRESFLPADKAQSDWGGAASYWYELEKKVDGKIIEATNLIVGSDKIEFTHLVAGSNGVSLSKDKKTYTISISVRLAGSVLAEQNDEILKAMVATISSKPVTVYTAIYDSFTSNETHGINEENYVTIGDCKIKVRIKDGVVTYQIKKE